METITRKLEFELSAGVWTDVTADNLPEYPVAWEDGIRSNSPVELLAGGSVLRFVMDNDSTNSAGLTGYYSPGHANCRAGFAEKMRVRFSLISGGTTYYQNIYWLKKPKPSAGLWEARITECEAMDWLELMAQTPLPALAAQVDKRMDELAALIIAALATAPAATSYETGASTFPTAFDVDRIERDTVYSALAKLCRSEIGRVYLQSGATAGLLRVEDRTYRLENTASLGTLADTMDGLELDPGDDLAFGSVEVTITPRRTDTANVVLARLTDRVELTPGENRPFTLYFTDPVGGARISGKSIVTPVAGTDYKFGSVDDGSSQDMNASLGVTVTAGGNSAGITLQNNASVSGFVNLFQLRGLGIYPYDKYTASAGSGLPVLSVDMPYESNLLIAESYANWLYGLISAGRYGCQARLHANKSAAMKTAALTGGISTRWTISETQTGISGDWFVNGRHCELGPGGRLDVTWWLTPADEAIVWILGTSALGVDTVLAPF